VTPGGTNGYGVPWQEGMPPKSAAQIIGEAAVYWNINPKVLLVTLQKEQSLIEVSNQYNASRLVKAMGYGIYSGSPNRFPGFGNQVFNAARGYSQYETRYSWVPGMGLRVEYQSSGEATIIVPANVCTYGLYKYTPYYPQKRFWEIYVRYFGDPQTPARMQPVYRFRNVNNGTYYYTASEAKRYTLLRTASEKWAFSGVAFTIDASATATTVPLYQMYNWVTKKYLYTTSNAKLKSLLAVRPKQWRYDKVTCYVSTSTSGTIPAYRLEHKTTHATLVTSSQASKTTLTSGRGALFIYRGISFRLGVSKTTTPPVGP